MKKIITTALAIAAIVVACKPANNPPTPNPPPPVPNASDCSEACDHLKYLGCEEGNPIDVGTPCKVDSDCGPPMSCSALGQCMITCTAWCTDLMSKGVDMNPTCVKDISSCSELETKCQVGKTN